MDYQTAQVWSDRVLPVGEAGEDVTVTVLSGDLVYYGDRDVNAQVHVGVLSVGQSVVVSVPSNWLRSASQSLVQLEGVAQPIPLSQLPPLVVNGASDPLIDAKGDLIVGTANDTRARHAVGADGTVLTADSTQADGVKWAGGGATKRVTLPLGGDGFGSSSGYTDFNARVLFKLPKNVTRFRLRFRNYSPAGDTANAGSWNFTGAYLGAPSYPGAVPDVWAGAFVSAPTQVLAPQTTPSDASEFVSGWIAPATFNLKAGLEYGLSWGANTGGAGQALSYSPSGGLFFWSVTNAGTTKSSSAGNAAVPGSPITYNPWDVRLEYEFSAFAGDLVGLCIGDSITNGAVDLGTINTILGAWPHQTWPGAAALRRGFAQINVAISGATSAYFAVATTDWRYSRADLVTTVPDFAVVSLGSNDVVNGASLSSFQSNMRTIITNLQALGITRIYVGTIIPRNLTAAQEAVRLSMNQWLRSLPDGVEGCFDFDKVMALPPQTAVTTATLTAGQGTAGTPITVASATGIQVGQIVTTLSGSTGALSISVPTTVTVVSGTSITLSQNAGTSGSATLQFTNPNPLADPDLMPVYPHPRTAGYQRMADLVEVR